MSEILSGRHQHFPGRGFFCKSGLEQVRPATRWELAECRAYLAEFIIYFHTIFIIHSHCNKLIFNTRWFANLFNLLSSKDIYWGAETENYDGHKTYADFTYDLCQTGLYMTGLTFAHPHHDLTNCVYNCMCQNHLLKRIQVRCFIVFDPALNMKWFVLSRHWIKNYPNIWIESSSLRNIIHKRSYFLSCKNNLFIIDVYELLLSLSE